MKLENLKAVVTGASTGIGRAIAIAIAQEGGQVALVARSLDGLIKTQKAIEELGGFAKIFVVDLREENGINSLAAQVKSEWGGVDIIVNAAGKWHEGDEIFYGSRLDETPPDQINNVFDVCIRAPMLLTRLFLPEMVSNKKGKILNISGTFYNGGSKWLHYYVAKKALEVFTKGLAEELQEHMIQVNCLSPNDTATEPLLKLFYEGKKPEIIMEPEEVARLAIFLLSSDADHITGQTISLRHRADPNHYILAQ